MAAVTNDVLVWNKEVELSQTAGNSSSMELDFSEADNKLLLIVEGAGKVTVEAGDGVQAGVDELSFTVSSKPMAIMLESGRFKKTTGKNKGKVVIKAASSSQKVSVIKLP